MKIEDLRLGQTVYYEDGTEGVVIKLSYSNSFPPGFVTVKLSDKSVRDIYSDFIYLEKPKKKVKRVGYVKIKLNETVAKIASPTLFI